MRFLLKTCRAILAEDNLDHASKLAKVRASLSASPLLALFSASDRRMARLLNEMVFRYSPKELAAYPGYYLAVEAIVAEEERAALPADPNLTYEKLLRYALGRSDLSVQQKTELIEALNDWLRSTYVAAGGTSTIPQPAWHAFDRLQAFRGTPSVPFEAYRGLVIRALGLAEESLAQPSAAIEDLAGYREYMAAIQAQKWELVPLYPELQDFNQGYR